MKLAGLKDKLYTDLANCHPKISRGRVWCHECGSIVRVDPSNCFRSGWPKCCGLTMSLDSPEERKQYDNNSNK